MLVEELLKTSSPDPWIEAIKSDVTAVLRSLPAGTDIDVDQVMARVRHDLLGEPMPEPRKITIVFDGSEAWDVKGPIYIHDSLVDAPRAILKKAAPTLQEVEAMIPGYLANHGPQNKSHLGRMYGVHHETLDRILVRLLGEKLVRRNGRLWENSTPTPAKQLGVVSLKDRVLHYLYENGNSSATRVSTALRVGHFRVSHLLSTLRAQGIVIATESSTGRLLYGSNKLKPKDEPKSTLPGATVNRSKRKKKGAGPSTEMEIRNLLNTHGTLSLDALRTRLKMGSTRTKRILKSMIRNKIVMWVPTSRGRDYTLVPTPVTSQHITIPKLVADMTQVASSGI